MAGPQFRRLAAQCCALVEGQGDLAQLDRLVAAIGTARPDVVVALTPPAVVAIKRADLGLATVFAFVGDPVAPGRYVIYARNGEDRLIAELNKAIARAFVEGDLKRIYSKYGIWNETQEKLAAPPPPMEKAKTISSLPKI